MKGVDAIGPMLEPTTTAEGKPAKTKDGKAFDDVLAEAVEQPAKGKAQPRAAASKGAPVETAPAQPRSIHGAIQKATSTEATDPELQLAEEAEVEEPTVLEEPRTPQQDQAVLAQIATVVARIVAPPQAQPKLEAPKVEAPVATETKATAQAVVAAPANDVAPPVNAKDFQDALSAFDLGPHEAQTLRPGAGEGAAAGDQEPRGPLGRALQALTGDGAPMRAAADKVMNAFRALSGRDSMPTVPAAAPSATMMNAPSLVPGPANAQAVSGAAAQPQISVSGNAAIPPPATPEVAQNPLAGTAFAPQARTAGGPDLPTLRPGAEQPQGAVVPTPTAGTPLASQAVKGQPMQGLPVQSQPVQSQPVQGQPVQSPPVQGQPVQSQAVQTVQGQPVPNLQGQPVQSQTVQTVQAQPVQTVQAQPVQTVQAQPVQTVHPVAGQALQVAPAQGQQPPAQVAPPAPAQPGQPAQPAQGQPTVQPANPQIAPGAKPLAPGQVLPPTANAQNVIAPANTNAQGPVVVEVQQQAVSEEAATDTEKSAPREDRVHGFSRGGWSGPAMSAYGGRGHESSGQGGSSDGGETARAFRREEERSAERAGDQNTPQFTLDPNARIQDPQQLTQPQQAPEVRPQNVPQNVPVPAAPVQELPDIVFQGRPVDPTAATENASISLHHPDLGPIQLEVHRELGRVEVHAVIESQHAQAVLRANESGIRQGVQQAGMTFNALRVRLRGSEQSNDRSGQERRRRGNQRET